MAFMNDIRILHIPEGLVDRSKPANIRSWSEQNAIEHGETKHGTTAFLDEQTQATKHIDNVKQCVN
jgi:hypothetical protein